MTYDGVELKFAALGYSLAQLVAKTSVWISPQIVEILEPIGGVWYPKHRRANLGLREKGKQLEHVGQVVNGINLDDNTYANTAFKRALAPRVRIVVASIDQPRGRR